MSISLCKDRTVILGGGLAGLSAAYHLKQGYSLFEKEKVPGGMARSIHKNGYIFDYDGHLLHFRKGYIFTLVKDLMDGNLAPHKRNSWIYSKQSYTRYPFQANFYGLPKEVVKDCLIGLIKAIPRQRLLRFVNEGNTNFNNWIRMRFGDGIAEHFMVPYNRKFWKVELSELTCEWLDGFIPLPSLEDTVTGAISNNTKPYGYNSRFWYPVKGGIYELVKAFLQRIKKINLNKKAVRINQYKKEIVFDDGYVTRFENLVTTIPMPELSNLLVDVPDRINKAFSLLRYLSIFVVNLGIQGDDITDKHWVYYPEDNSVFYRTGFPTNFSMDVAPSKKTSIYAEISYRDNKIDREKVVNDTVKNLEELGIVGSRRDVDICLPVDIKYGYVLYDSNRNWATEVIKDYLKKFDIYTIGRYGSWRYMSMEDVIEEGNEIARLVRSKVR